MSAPSVAPITTALKAARVAKKLSQRELGQKTGKPQGHISNIEAGRVDLTTSSLVELARALDLELMLIPRALGPAIRGLIRVSEETGNEAQARNQIAQSNGDTAVPPAYSLDDEAD